MENYKSKLNELYLEAKENECPPDNKFQFLGNEIFDFTTYDASVDELFAKRMIEVLDCIVNKTTFEYHKHGENEVNYINYLTMVNMKFLKNKLEWGTSIRGAWLDEYGHHSEPEPRQYNITYDWSIPKGDISEFIKQLIEWSNEA